MYFYTVHVVQCVTFFTQQYVLNILAQNDDRIALFLLITAECSLYGSTIFT